MPPSFASWPATPRASSRRARPGDAITEVADRVLADAVDHAAPTVPFAVIGLGKLGARELNFASDLDVVFVYEGEGPDDLASGVAAAERVMQLVRDAGWEIDADLRPEGRTGHSRVRSPGSSSTGSATPSRGNPRRSSGRAPSRATGRSVGASSWPRATSRTRLTASRSIARSRCAGCASGWSANA